MKTKLMKTKLMKTKHLLSILILLIFCFGYTFQLKNNDFSTFLSLFKEIELPASTLFLNYSSYDQEKEKKIPSSLALKYICNNNDSCLKYHYKLINMVTNNVTEEGDEPYDFRAIFKIELSNYKFIVYPKFDYKLNKYYLNVYDYKGTLLDTLLINCVKGKTEYSLFRHSYLTNDLNIYISEYRYLNIKNDSNYKSEINSFHYFFDQEKGKFLLKRKSSKFSKCMVDDFAEKKQKCLKEDSIFQFLR